MVRKHSPIWSYLVGTFTRCEPVTRCPGNASTDTEGRGDTDDAAVHLLFSANRWEASKSIKQKLQEGQSIVLDRYAFSGVAFTAAKGTQSIDWCKGPDVGLPRPDVVIYLNVSSVSSVPSIVQDVR